MKERPILFNGPMVRALLDGSKTQTRRVVKGSDRWPACAVRAAILSTRGTAMAIDSKRLSYGPEIKCPYGMPGDRIQVKEAAWMWCERRPNGKTATGRDKWLYVPLREAPIHYAADHPARPQVDVVSPETGNKWGWRFKVGRFLPARASRITLEVISVRVERLQDVSRGDAMEEGCPFPNMAQGDDPRQWYAELWEQINGPGSWDANPWVWAIEFKRITP